MNLPICIPHIGAHNPRILGRGKCTKLSSSSVSSTPPRHRSPPPPAQLLLLLRRRRRRPRVKQRSSEEGGGGGLFANLARSLSCRALLRWYGGPLLLFLLFPCESPTTAAAATTTTTNSSFCSLQSKRYEYSW
ncbi:hypothetical protein DAI22_10g021850 [Oryza sativa Japonica Group]|nr:hypothetical protein DAI22_10g021850 [Oryza sativa Japonica Group]